MHRPSCLNAESPTERDYFNASLFGETHRPSHCRYVGDFASCFAIQENLGDPLRELVGQSVSEEVRNELREELGLNDSFVQQYGRFLGKALQGDLGTSYFFQTTGS